MKKLLIIAIILLLLAQGALAQDEDRPSVWFLVVGENGETKAIQTGLPDVMVSAQDYHIRVSQNSNLRAEHSLESEIVETAPAGSVLNVVGQFNRWLKIDWMGRDLWIADWIAHTRVAGGEAPSSQPQSSQIDNCCFVDRQCVSDADWVSGYRAFQDKQCPLPPAQTATSSTISLPPGADNCCQASGAACMSNEDWTQGYLNFQAGQCKHPAVLIEGSPRFVARVEAVLDMLKTRVPKWYTYTISELKHIYESSPGIVGVAAWLRSFALSPEHVGLDDADVERAVGWLGGVLVHEACHIHRDKAGLQSGGLVGETDCLQIQISALQDFYPQASFMDYLLRVLANIEKEEYQWWH